MFHSLSLKTQLSSKMVKFFNVSSFAAEMETNSFPIHLRILNRPHRTGNSSRNNFAMQTKGYIIGAFSLLENIAKLVLSLIVLRFQNELSQNDQTITKTGR